MPPKKQDTHRTSNLRNSLSSEQIPIVPIYQFLTNATIRDPINDLTNRIEISFKQNPQIVKRSLIFLIIKCCGLQDYTSDFNFNQIIQSLKAILQKLEEEKLPLNDEPLIIHSKTNVNFSFINRLKQFLQILISDDLELVFDPKIQLLPSILAWIGLLSKSKIRLIRSCSIQFLKYFVEQQIKYFNYLMEEKQSKKAFVISKNISYILENVLSQRINDVDNLIRETSIHLVRDILIQIESQLLNQNILKKLFDNCIGQKPKSIQNVLEVMLHLLQKTKNKKDVIRYLLKNLSNLQILALNASYNGVLSLKILMKIYKIDQSLQTLKPATIIKIFSNYAQQKFLSGLTLAIQVFFATIYSDDSMIQINSVIVLTQILHLLQSINNEKLVKTILRQFFIYHKQKADAIFSIQSMINLLLAEYYRNASEDVALQKNQLSYLAKTICEYSIFCQQRWKQAVQSQKQKFYDYLQTYNTLLLTSSKEIFFQKIQNKEYQKICHDYLRMFSLMHFPIVGSLQAYIQFIIQRTQKIFLQDTGNGQVYKQVINIHSSFQIQNVKKLAEKIELDENTQIITKQNVYRISSILVKYNVPSFITTQMLTLYINSFQKASFTSVSLKIQLMTIFVSFIQKTFENVLQNPTHSAAHFYKISRQKIISFLTQVLDNIDQNFIIKLSCFKTLLKIIQIVSNFVFQEVNPNMVFQIEEKVYRVIYGFVSYHFDMNLQNQDATLDISRLMSALSFQNLQIKQEMVKNLFTTYAHSFTFACHPFSVKSMLYLLKKEEQLKDMNQSKSIQYVEGFQRKTISNYMQDLLIRYSYEQSLSKNANKFIFWRLCSQLLSQSYDQSNHDSLLQKIIQLYFKKKLQTQNHKNLLNKLILFLITSIQKIISKSEFQKIEIYKNILKKVHRRYDKVVLLRFKQYVNQKIQTINNPYLNQFLDYVSDISKTAKDKKTKPKNKMKMQNEEEEDEGQSQNDQNNQKQINKMEIQQDNSKNRKNKSNLNVNFEKRQTRSSMKHRQNN